MRPLTIMVLLASAAAACACGSARRVTAAETHRDSTRVEVRTVVEYIHDTVRFEIPAQTAERTSRDSTSHLENDYATSDAHINPDGTLYHDLKTRPQEKEIPVDVPKERRDSVIFRDRVVTYTVPVEKELSSWQKTQMRGFWILLSLALMYVLRKPLKHILKSLLLR